MQSDFYHFLNISAFIVQAFQHTLDVQVERDSDNYCSSVEEVLSENKEKVQGASQVPI